MKIEIKLESMNDLLRVLSPETEFIFRKEAPLTNFQGLYEYFVLAGLADCVVKFVYFDKKFYDGFLLFDTYKGTFREGEPSVVNAHERAIAIVSVEDIEFEEE